MLLIFRSVSYAPINARPSPGESHDVRPARPQTWGYHASFAAALFLRLGSKQHLAAVGVDDYDRIAAEQRAAGHEGLMRVLRVDEVGAVGVAGVDAREDLPGYRPDRIRPKPR